MLISDTILFSESLMSINRSCLNRQIFYFSGLTRTGLTTFAQAQFSSSKLCFFAQVAKQTNEQSCLKTSKERSIEQLPLSC